MPPLLQPSVGVSIFILATPSLRFSHAPSFVTYSSAPPPPYTLAYITPYVPPHPTGAILPGNVPASVPREVRYELIRGVLTPVEHFRGADIGMNGIRGYNYTYGFDTGYQQSAVGNGGWNPIHCFDQGPAPPISGNWAWNPVHGSDQRPQTPNFVPGGSAATRDFPPQVAITENNAGAAAQPTPATSDALAGSEPMASRNKGASASKNTQGSEPADQPSTESSSTADAGEQQRRCS